MSGRGIPWDYVRNKTMSKVDRDRKRFIAWVQGVNERHNGSTDFPAKFEQLLRGDGVLPWISVRDFAGTVLAKASTGS